MPAHESQPPGPARARIQFTLDVTAEGGHQFALDADGEAAEVSARCVEGEDSTVTELTCRVVTPRPGLARSLPSAGQAVTVATTAVDELGAPEGACVCGSTDSEVYACAECATFLQLAAGEVG